MTLIIPIKKVYVDVKYIMERFIFNICGGYRRPHNEKYVYIGLELGLLTEWTGPKWRRSTAHIKDPKIGGSYVDRVPKRRDPGKGTRNRRKYS